MGKFGAVLAITDILRDSARLKRGYLVWAGIKALKHYTKVA